MSELSVGTLSGLAANGYVVDVASGSTLDLSNGATLPAGSILQVVSTAKTDPFSVSLGDGGFSSAVTGLTATITPRSSSSKILVMVTVNGSNSGNGSAVAFRLTRDGAPVFIGDSAGGSNRLTSYAYVDSTNDARGSNVSATFLDSPSTTSSITYGINLHNPHSGTFTYYLNRTASSTENVFFPRTASSITLMEVAV